MPRLISIVAILALAAMACRATSQQYTLRVTFNERYSDAAARAVDDAVHRYDANATSLMQPTYPPIISVTFRTRDAAACVAIEATLRSNPAVATVDCNPRP